MFSLSSTATNDKWYLPVRTIIIGRGPKSMLNLGKNNTISRQHATLRITKGTFDPKTPNTLHKIELHDGIYKEDTKKWKPSASGTFVNDTQLLNDWVEVFETDVLKFSVLEFKLKACKWKLVTSKINTADKTQLRQLSAVCGFHIVNQVARDRATHLIMPEASATPKAVQALSLNIPVVSIELFKDVAALKTSKNIRQINLDSARYKPKLADDASNMSGSPAQFFPVPARATIFQNDIFFFEKTNRHSKWLADSIVQCGGKIDSKITAGKQRYVVESGSSGFMQAAYKIGAEKVGVSEIATAIVRAVPIRKSIDIISQSQSQSQRSNSLGGPNSLMSISQRSISEPPNRMEPPAPPAPSVPSSSTSSTSSTSSSSSKRSRTDGQKKTTSSSSSSSSSSDIFDMAPPAAPAAGQPKKKKQKVAKATPPSLVAVNAVGNDNSDPMEITEEKEEKEVTIIEDSQQEEQQQQEEQEEQQEEIVIEISPKKKKEKGKKKKQGKVQKVVVAVAANNEEEKNEQNEHNEDNEHNEHKKKNENVSNEEVPNEEVPNKDNQDDDDGEDEDEEEDEEDAPPPPHANINGVVWVTRKKNKKRKKGAKIIPVVYFELSEQSEEVHRAQPKQKKARSGTAVWQEGKGKCFVKQRFHKCEPLDDNDFHAVAIERSERMIQIQNQQERADEDEANIASRFVMNPTGKGRKKNVVRKKRR